VITVLFAVVSNAYGQNWQPYFENPEVRIEISEYNWKDLKFGKDHERFIFRYTNLTDENIQISFQRRLVFNGENEVFQEVEYKIDLAPKEERSYFSDEQDKTYYLFRKDNHGMIKQVLTDFELRNFKISR
jgi:hypothetical protein